MRCSATSRGRPESTATGKPERHSAASPKPSRMSKRKQATAILVVVADRQGEHAVAVEEQAGDALEMAGRDSGTSAVVLSLECAAEAMATPPRVRR